MERSACGVTYLSATLRRLHSDKHYSECEAAGRRSRLFAFLVLHVPLVAGVGVLFSYVRASRQCRKPKDLRDVFEFAACCLISVKASGSVLQCNWPLVHTRTLFLTTHHCILMHRLHPHSLCSPCYSRYCLGIL